MVASSACTYESMYTSRLEVEGTVSRSSSRAVCASTTGVAVTAGIHGFHPFLVFFMCRSRLFLMRRRFRWVFWSECLMAASLLSLVLCRVNLVTPAAPATGATPAAPASLPRLGLVHRQRPTVHLLATEGGDGRLGLLVGLHLDEGEALGL